MFHVRAFFYSDRHLIVGPMLGDLLGKLGRTVYFDAVDLDDHVARANAGRMGRPFRIDFGDIDSARLPNAGFLTLLRLEELFGQRNILNAEHRALHDSVLLQVDDHFLDDRRRNGERIADVSAAARLDQRIDADQLAFRVDQRAAAVARIDRRVGLDERLEAELARQRLQATAFGAHDAGRNRAAQVERAADGEHPLAQTQVVRVAHRDRRQVRRVDLNERHVGRRVGPDHLRVERTVVVQRHAQFRGVFHDMVIRDDIPVGADDHARPAALALARLLGLLLIPPGHAEELEKLLESASPAVIVVLDLLRIDDIDDAFHRILGGIRQIGIAPRLVRSEMRTHVRSELGRRSGIGLGRPGHAVGSRCAGGHRGGQHACK